MVDAFTGYGLDAHSEQPAENRDKPRRRGRGNPYAQSNRNSRQQVNISDQKAGNQADERNQLNPYKHQQGHDGNSSSRSARGRNHQGHRANRSGQWALRPATGSPFRSGESPTIPSEGHNYTMSQIRPSELKDGLVPRQGKIPHLRASTAWKFEPEIKIKVSRLGSTSILKVYEMLSRFGNIAHINMIGGLDVQGALVTFRPPPVQPIWELYENMEKIEHRIFPIDSPVQQGVKYPELTILYPSTLQFGVMIDPSTMMIMNTAETRNRDMHLVLNLKRKEIQIMFTLHLGKDTTKLGYKYQFRLPIAQLERIFESPSNGSEHAILIPFNTAPEVFKQMTNVSKAFPNPLDRKKTKWSSWELWERKTCIKDRHTEITMMDKAIDSRDDTAVIDIGRWTTYRLTFSKDGLNGSAYQNFRQALADHNVPFIPSSDIKLVDKLKPLIWEYLHDEPATDAVQQKQVPESQSYLDQLSTSQIPLSFPVRYQLEVCLTNGWINEMNVTREFLQELALRDPQEATYILEKVADRQIRYYNPTEIFSISIRGKVTRNVPSYCALTRAANVTPTMIHLATPLVETSNRIMRAYQGYEDRFLRVRFTDEKTIGRINPQDNNRSEDLFRRIKQAMKQGIVVAGRYYQFLAFGNSQFREHGAYFFSPCNTLEVQDIRMKMGNFSHILTPAKYGARIGQCFSTTRAITSTKVEIIEIPDVVRNGYTFTDGVGKLSTFLAQMAAKELGLQNPFDDYPSLFQFRLGGCKGVLALDPGLKRQEVHIRPSQYKFAAPQKGLEIIRSSAFATACLNRQLIMVLSALGVPDNVFLNKQQIMARDLELATQSESVAVAKLQRNIDMNQTTLAMAKMVLDGFMRAKEPFMMSLLQLWRAYNIKYLKEKARVVIEHGAFVLGCVDETATLKGHMNDPQSRPGATRSEKLRTLPEIFLQVADTEKPGSYKVVEGVCVLARNPSLHAGDLRVVRAVDVPALQHLKNVVVLPQTGDRDLANMCSGGDLDGDDYIIIWDHDLIPAEINAEPMDFTPEKPQNLDRPVQVEDIIDFFITYMKNDSLARIALAHLAQADFHSQGVKDETCLQLAALHSQAVDYPKSGIPAIMEPELRPFKWPHFMENKWRTPDKIYKSKKVLGRMYDQIQLVDFKPQYELEFDVRVLSAFELEHEMLSKAKALKEQYDAAIRRVMAKYAIRTEFEAWTAFVLSHNQEGRNYTFAEDLGRIVGAIKDQFTELCKNEAGARASNDYTHLAPFVAAMYTVTADEMKQALTECQTTKMVGGKPVPVREMVPEQMPFMSFPWLFIDELGKIANGHPLQNQPAALEWLVRKTAKRGNVSKKKDVPQGGDVQTKEGVTRPGDLLLLFDDVAAPAPESRGATQHEHPVGSYLSELSEQVKLEVKAAVNGESVENTLSEGNQGVEQQPMVDVAEEAEEEEVQLDLGGESSTLDVLARMLERVS